MFNKFLQVEGRSQNIISKVNTERNPDGPMEYGEELLRRNQKTQIYQTLGMPPNISQEMLEVSGFPLSHFLFYFKILKRRREKCILRVQKRKGGNNSVFYKLSTNCKGIFTKTKFSSSFLRTVANWAEGKQRIRGERETAHRIPILPLINP